ncbi:MULTISPECIES: alpha/beta hydrolase [unclassified Pseudoalteromonas]|uniref:alpha/beta hydrolase n=1 Tax=unclassified Pseudoalteromonas TaxID=194690 RepID=UPI001EEA622C|nr:MULTISPECIES: alpha/beta hydrolase-fold protein [unclassified Pseudoalteromonas]MCF2829194.1 alpha/beta hydrolase [Pseudoalteromonas sp. OF5H-5]MCF2829848.1 alpha/beta hydrolase [Pseudoalteromonas sp. DL2-H6]MCF2926658.1 alpha/beta hydrolase [Pseudoalteromonas sp. DL2-H1]MCG7554760.1 alpha/beta hydrolase [Pseudoalteromonas sp. Of11M-6]
MKRYLFSLLGLIAIVAAGWKFTQYQSHYTSDYVDVVLSSQVLNEDRKVFIRLPKGYDKAHSYPLIIRTDGNFNLARWDEVLSSLAEQGRVEDAILVSIPNQFWTETRNRDLVPPYARQDVAIEARPESDNDPAIFGRADRFLQFVESELLPYLEANYSINDNRVLSGFSAGGSFVLYTMVTKPALFDGYFAFSPAAWYDDSVVVKEFAKSLANIQGKPKYIYLSIGGAENDIITGSFRGLLEALEQHAPANVRWGHSISEGAGHSQNPVVSVPLALSEYHHFRKNQLM